MLEIKLEPNGMGGRWTCYYCGNGFELDNIVILLCEDGKQVGDICFECFNGGPEVRRRHLLNKASELREETKTVVQEMLTEADMLEKEATREIDCPTQLEYKQLETELIKMWEAERRRDDG